MFKSRITWILFMLLWMAILTMQAYNLGYSSAQHYYEDREWSLRIKHSDELDAVYKKLSEARKDEKEK